MTAFCSKYHFVITNSTTNWQDKTCLWRGRRCPFLKKLCHSSKSGKPQSSGLKSSKEFNCWCGECASDVLDVEIQTQFMLALKAASTPSGASSKTRKCFGSMSGANFVAASSKISGFGLATATWNSDKDAFYGVRKDTQIDIFVLQLVK